MARQAEPDQVEVAPAGPAGVDRHADAAAAVRVAAQALNEAVERANDLGLMVDVDPGIPLERMGKPTQRGVTVSIYRRL